MSVEVTQLERLLEVRRFHELRQLLQRAFAASPNDPHLHCIAARAALSVDDWDKTEEHVRAALASDPLHFEARVLHFVAAEHAMRYAEAERTITELIREQPYNGALLALYAELMLTTMHLAKARALAVEALRRDPEHTRARIVHTLLCVVEGDRTAANEELATLMRDDPEAVEVVATLFRVLVEQRRYAEALEIGRELLRHEPDNPKLAEALADLRVQTHWIGWPAYPLRRFGWAGSAGMWALGLGSTQVVADVYGPIAGSVTGGLYLAYVLYTWAYPSLLKRWLLRRGF